MKAMGFMTGHVSTLALGVGGVLRGEKTRENKGFANLKSIQSISLLGQHGGVLDDDLFDLLAEAAA